MVCSVAQVIAHLVNNLLSKIRHQYNIEEIFFFSASTFEPRNTTDLLFITQSGVADFFQPRRLVCGLKVIRKHVCEDHLNCG